MSRTQAVHPDILAPALGHLMDEQTALGMGWTPIVLTRQEHSRTHASIFTLLRRLKSGLITWSSLKVCIQGSQPYALSR